MTAVKSRENSTALPDNEHMLAPLICWGVTGGSL